jgi:putative addiction module killer protein
MITHMVATMPEAREYLRADGSCPFGDRFAGIGDARAQARIDTTVRKLGRGLKPDVKPVGEGVHEARIDYGPGYRVYFGNDGEDVLVLLLCGDKRTQDQDIPTAKALWAEYRTRKATPPPKEGQPQPPPLLRPDEEE